MKLLHWRRPEKVRSAVQSLFRIVVVASAAFATPVTATTVCYPRDQMLSYIARDLQASKQANGIVRPFSVMELFVSDRDGDWVIVTTDLDGTSCIVAYGEDFSAERPLGSG